jgi:hypothetical protein
MTVLKASDTLSVFHAALWWFDKNPEEKLQYGPYAWIVLLTRDQEVFDLAYAMLSEIERGSLTAVQTSRLLGIPDSWKSRLGDLPGNLNPRGTLITAGSLMQFAARRNEKPRLLAHLVADPITHSGGAGRPSSMHLIEKNMRQRAERGELATKLSEETNYQASWIRDAHPELRPVTAKAIANSLRDVYKSLKAS